MLRLTLAVARKDLSLTLARGSGLIQALLLGLLLLFVFSLSQGIGERMSPQAAALPSQTPWMGAGQSNRPRRALLASSRA